MPENSATVRKPVLKFLCVCEGGTVRSVAMSYMLKYSFGQDALACSWAKNSTETMKILCEWSDRIIPMQAKFALYIPEEHKHKIKICDVGTDRWSNPLNQELVNLAGEFVQKWSSENFELAEATKTNS